MGLQDSDLSYHTALSNAGDHPTNRIPDPPSTREPHAEHSQSNLLPVYYYQSLRFVDSSSRVFKLPQTRTLVGQLQVQPPTSPGVITLLPSPFQDAFRASSFSCDAMSRSCTTLATINILSLSSIQLVILLEVGIASGNSRHLKSVLLRL